MLQSHSAKLLSGTNAAPAFVLNDLCPPTAGIKPKHRTNRYSVSRVLAKLQRVAVTSLHPTRHFQVSLGRRGSLQKQGLYSKRTWCWRQQCWRNWRGRGERTAGESTGKLASFLSRLSLRFAQPLVDPLQTPQNIPLPRPFFSLAFEQLVEVLGLKN